LIIGVEDLIEGTQVLLGVAMTVKAPAHLQGLTLPSYRHLADWAVTGRTANALGNMNAVIEIDVIWQVVDSGPLDGSVVLEAVPDGCQDSRVRPYLRVARHASLRRWNPSEGCIFNRCVAVTTIEPETFDMMLVTKGHGLRDDHDLLSQVGRPDNQPPHDPYYGRQEPPPDDAQQGNRVGGTMEDLPH
jgi:hypothetical protein